MRLLTTTKTVFEFHELSDKAKAAARQAYVEQDGYPHDDWWEFDDFVECAKCLGIEIASSKIIQPDILFSGFSSQGDGASFTGEYNNKPDCLKAITDHAPGDKVLISLAERLTALQTATKLIWDDHLEATITRSRNSSVHSMSMNIEVQAIDPGGTVNPRFPNEDDCTPTQDEAKELTEILRAFADWIYKELEAQHDYYYSNDYVDSCLEEAEFNSDGVII